jgi:hypothetical protein
VPTPLPPCPSLRGQPCRTSYGNATPTAVSASAAGGRAKVTWHEPSTVRAGDTISGYTVRESPDGAQVTAMAGATKARFAGLAAGPHFFTVEAVYAGGGASGLSTPSNTVGVTAAVAHWIAFARAAVTAIAASNGDGNGPNDPTSTSATAQPVNGQARQPIRAAANGSAAAVSNGGNADDGLVFTGGDVMATSLIGVGMLVMGLALPLGLRRRPENSRLADS